MGAAYLAGLSVGFWKNTEEIKENWAVDREFTPDISEDARSQRLAGWKKAVCATRGWSK